MSVVLMVLLVVFVLRRISGAAMRPVGAWRCGGVRMREAELRDPMRQRQQVPAPRVESPLESLQRRFSAGTIGVEEYEREVGKLYGLK